MRVFFLPKILHSTFWRLFFILGTHPLPTLQNYEPVPQVIETGCKPVLFQFQLGKDIEVRDLLNTLYETACAKKSWGIIRHSAGMLKYFSSMLLLFYYLAPLQNDCLVTSRCMQFTFWDKREVYLQNKSALPVTKKESMQEGKKSTLVLQVNLSIVPKVKCTHCYITRQSFCKGAK